MSLGRVFGKVFGKSIWKRVFGKSSWKRVFEKESLERVVASRKVFAKESLPAGRITFLAPFCTGSKDSSGEAVNLCRQRRLKEQLHAQGWDKYLPVSRFPWGFRRAPGPFLCPADRDCIQPCFSVYTVTKRRNLLCLFHSRQRPGEAGVTKCFVTPWKKYRFKSVLFGR